MVRCVNREGNAFWPTKGLVRGQFCVPEGLSTKELATYQGYIWLKRILFWGGEEASLVILLKGQGPRQHLWWQRSHKNNEKANVAVLQATGERKPNTIILTGRHCGKYSDNVLRFVSETQRKRLDYCFLVLPTTTRRISWHIFESNHMAPLVFLMVPSISQVIKKSFTGQWLICSTGFDQQTFVELMSE